MNRLCIGRVALCGPLVLGALFTGACKPQLTPPVPPLPAVTPPLDTWVDTGDMGAPPPCAAPEVEPNDGDQQASDLPFERTGCGVLSPGDRDAFAFTVVDPGWVSLEVERGNGSIADVDVTVRGPDGLRIDKSDDTESTDVTVRFQAELGDYVAVVSEQNGQGGDRFTYEILVSEAKAPVEWVRLEVEPNNAGDEAELVSEAVTAIYGTLDGNAELQDRDWYELRIPGGEHALHVDVDAFAYGAAGDVRVDVRDTDDKLIRAFVDERIGGARENDPRGTYASPGDEMIRLQVVEESGLEGPAQWYVLKLELEVL